jgi:hypothetical protein
MKHFTTAIYASTDRNDKFKKYDALLRTFPRSRVITDQSFHEADLAIVYSWIREHNTELKDTSSKAAITAYKKHIIDSQIKASSHTMAIDNSLFVYRDPLFQYNYLRFSLDGIFANTGYYLDKEVDPSRWSIIQRNLGIQVKPWRKTGNHVLVCLQRNNGFSFNREGGIIDWLESLLNDLLRRTDRPIVIRGHPGDKKMSAEIKRAVNRVVNDKIRKSIRFQKSIKNIEEIVSLYPISMSTNQRIEDDLKDAWCCITYNSSPSTVSAIEGIPVFVLDPIPQKSQAYPVCNTDLNQIEYPMMPDNRQEWLEKIAMSHFSYDDIEDGLLYKAVAKFFGEKDAGI